jgi:predicted glycosyltransferase
MRILFEITHPKHAHLFRHAIGALRARGHQVAATARDKDVTVDLLRAWGLDFKVLTALPRAGLLGLGAELLRRDWRLWRFARRFRPDVLVARVGPSAGHVGLLLRRPVIVFEDTEDGTLQQRIAFPFASRICTARHYEKDWGRKHVRYPSFDELAYLHPRRFTPDPQVAADAGLEPGGYVVVRFVSWRAAHDLGQSGIDAGRRLEVLEALEGYGRVLVTSEAALPAEFERFRLPVAPEDFHHVLAFARLALGESATVAAEAAMLGVPAVLVSTLNWGSINRLRDHYGMVFQTRSQAEGLELAVGLLEDPHTPDLWRRRREELLEHEADLTDWMVREIEATGGGR